MAAPGPTLTACELSVCSQNGEDGVLQALLRALGVQSRFFVEFGVGAGDEGNCVFLADWCGWSGLFIESSFPDYSRLSLKYRRNPLVRTRQAVVQAGNVEALFTEERVPSAFDVLSIDIDGNDFWVWEAITSFQPRIALLEYNANLPLESELVMPPDDQHAWDGTDYFGASLGAYRALGRTKGYELVHTDSTGVNAFFVRREEAAGLPLGEAVPRHAANYLGQGLGMPQDPLGRPFHELGSGELLDAPRTSPARSGDATRESASDGPELSRRRRRGGS
ncbi:MAG: hypothetical protein ACR2JH_11525 [Solirubrobacteraceae bacterium]